MESAFRLELSGEQKGLDNFSTFEKNDNLIKRFRMSRSSSSSV